MTRRLLTFALLLGAACGRGDAPLPRTTLTDGTGDIWSFAYSPDGSRLAYLHSGEEGVRVLVGAADGSAVRAVSEPATFTGPPVWAGDGSRLYFSSSASGRFGLHAAFPDSGMARWILPEFPLAIAMSAHQTQGLLFVALVGGGGDFYRVPPGAEAAEAVLVSKDDEVGGYWSPDGTRVAYAVARDGREVVEVLTLADGARVRVGPPDGSTQGFGLRWVPDGSAVIFPAAPFGNLDLYVAPADGSAPRQLTRDIRDDWAPALSPDGRWVAFLSARGGQTDVWVVPFEGGEPRRVTDDPVAEEFPAWTPDGSAVVFTHGAAPQEVHLVSVASGQSRELVARERSAAGAEFAEGGQSVVFRMAHNGVEELWTVPAAGGEPRPLTEDGLPKLLFAVSHDGAQVYYLAQDGLGTNLYRVPVAGGTPTALTSDAAQKLSFTLLSETADGSLLGYLAISGDGGYEYFTVPTAGGTPRIVTRFGSVANGALLPDGSAAVVTSYHGTDGQSQLYLVPLDGTPSRMVETGVGWVFDARPSPDGGTIAFAGLEEGQVVLRVVPTAGGPARRLSPPGMSVGSHIWMPDGASLVASLGPASAGRLALIRVSDGEITWLTEPGASASGGWPSPDGSQIVYGRSEPRRQLVKVDVSRLLAPP